MCEIIVSSSSCVLKTSSSSVLPKKAYKKTADTVFVKYKSTSDISGSFNSYAITAVKDDVNECRDYFNTFINNPTWGWIVFVIFLIVIWGHKFYELLDVYITKIKNSKSAKIGIGPFNTSFEDISTEPPSFEKDSLKSHDGSINLDKNEGEKDCEVKYDIYFPAYDEILKNNVSNKILSTLWKYQQIYGKNDNNRTRWSFYEPNDSEFMFVARKLYWSGLIIANGQQYMLSNVGIRFCMKYENRLNLKNLYSSFLK